MNSLGNTHMFFEN